MKSQDDCDSYALPHLLYNRSIGNESFNRKKRKAIRTELLKLAEDQAACGVLNEKVCELPPNVRSTFLMTFSSDKTKVASTHGDHNIYITDIQSGKCIQTLEGHPRTPWCIAFHPTFNDILASGCLGGHVRVWDLHGGSEVWVSENNSVIASIAFHPTDKLLVIATLNEIHFWNWNFAKPYAKCKTSSEREKVRYVKFDPLGRFLITGIANRTPPVGQLPGERKPKVCTTSSNTEPRKRPHETFSPETSDAEHRPKQKPRSNTTEPSTSQENTETPSTSGVNNQPQGQSSLSEFRTHMRRRTEQIEDVLDFIRGVRSPEEAVAFSDQEDADHRIMFGDLLNNIVLMQRVMLERLNYTQLRPAPSDTNANPDEIHDYADEGDSMTVSYQELMGEPNPVDSSYPDPTTVPSIVSYGDSHASSSSSGQNFYSILNNCMHFSRRIESLFTRIKTSQNRAGENSSTDNTSDNSESNSTTGEFDFVFVTNPVITRMLNISLKGLTSTIQSLTENRTNSNANRLPVIQERLHSTIINLLQILNKVQNITLISNFSTFTVHLSRELIVLCALLLRLAPSVTEETTLLDYSVLEGMLLFLIKSSTKIINLEQQCQRLGLLTSAVVSSPMPASSLNWRDERTVTILPNPFNQENIDSGLSVRPQAEEPPLPPTSSAPSRSDLSNSHPFARRLIYVLRRRIQNTDSTTRQLTINTSSANSRINQNRTANEDAWRSRWSRRRSNIGQRSRNIVVGRMLRVNLGQQSGSEFPAPVAPRSSTPDHQPAASSANDVAGFDPEPEELRNNSDSEIYSSNHIPDEMDDLMDAALTMTRTTPSASETAAQPNDSDVNPSPVRISSASSSFHVPRVLIERVDSENSYLPTGNRPRSPPVGRLLLDPPPADIFRMNIPSSTRQESNRLFYSPNYTFSNLVSYPSTSSSERSNDSFIADWHSRMFYIGNGFRHQRQWNSFYGKNLTYRIQKWKFSTSSPPNISSSTASMIVASCNIHNDASIDISHDGNLLVALVPVYRQNLDNYDGIMLGVYSLQDKSLGHCLHVWSYGFGALTVSFSPFARYIMVGMASTSRVQSSGSDVLNRRPMLEVLKIDKDKDQIELVYIRKLDYTANVSRRQYVSLNAAFWLPEPGAGIVYGTNCGDLRILYPRYGGAVYAEIRSKVSRTRRKTNSEVHSFNSATTGTQTLPYTNTISTQTSNQDYS